MTEATHALIDMAFRTREIDQIDARCRVTNIPSRRVIQKCGFQFGAPAWSVRWHWVVWYR